MIPAEILQEQEPDAFVPVFGKLNGKPRKGRYLFRYGSILVPVEPSILTEGHKPPDTFNQAAFDATTITHSAGNETPFVVEYREMLFFAFSRTAL